jgi:arylamine N-acetyltransferase
MSHAIDLDAYLRRIGYVGGREATLDTLAALHLHHARTIAFENLDPLLGRPIALDAASLERKLIHDGRGGYCYEQNLLFGHVLRALGFQVTGLAARVLWTYYADDAITARSHQLLRVQNYYASSHPTSRFVSSLIAAPPATDRRYTLADNQLAVHHLGGPTERRVLETVSELRETLESVFLLRLPDTPELDTALARLLWMP